ncbi:hypothetical protein BC832DRAFT_360259 [Gaertneriomyces semiglobifer]|nr:hypothetical protein BC832DRAFT_360259 [Gaertneriomyces semiglobifer]
MDDFLLSRQVQPLILLLPKSRTNSSHGRLPLAHNTWKVRSHIVQSHVRSDACPRPRLDKGKARADRYLPKHRPSIVQPHHMPCHEVAPQLLTHNRNRTPDPGHRTYQPHHSHVHRGFENGGESNLRIHSFCRSPASLRTRLSAIRLRSPGHPPL